MEPDIRLAGFGIRTEPLSIDHAHALNAVVDEKLWAGMTFARPRDNAARSRAIAAQVASPRGFSFAMIDATCAMTMRSTSSNMCISRRVRDFTAG